MHEYSIVQTLIGCVEKETREARAQGAVVRRVNLRMGALCGVESELLRLAFETFRERSVCAEAELHISHVDAKWACRSCGLEIVRGPLQCSECGSPGKLLHGDEMILERIELDVTEATDV
ncbi:MAG: hypothetical protein A2341_22275 [Deltaproteobacteria bacterium RIFOXYB12_FULL_58_9]|nr:MAG: hypothetical protein A2341_22275 [Deltaproteobacteria bacterium RIFOXYB12_FULL_58_9]